MSYEAKVEKRELACILTDEEINRYAKELAAAQTEKYATEGRKKEALSEFTAQINRCDSNILVLTRKIDSGQEIRPVDCYYEHDWENSEKTLYRKDTKVLVKIEEIEPWEKQQHLKLTKKPSACTDCVGTEGEHDKGCPQLSEGEETEQDEPDAPEAEEESVASEGTDETEEVSDQDESGDAENDNSLNYECKACGEGFDEADDGPDQENSSCPHCKSTEWF